MEEIICGFPALLKCIVVILIFFKIFSPRKAKNNNKFSYNRKVKTPDTTPNPRIIVDTTKPTKVKNT